MSYGAACTSILARMFEDQAIFVPDECHDKSVEDRQGDQPDALRVGIAIELISDEKAENIQGCRIGP